MSGIAMDVEHDEKIAGLFASAKEKSEQNARIEENRTELLDDKNEQDNKNEPEQQQEGSLTNSAIAIMIYGLNKHATAKELESYIQKQQQRGDLDSAFTYKKLKKPPGAIFASMTFDKIEDQELALKVLGGMEFRKNILRCEVKRHNRGGGKRDREQGKGGDDNGKKRSKNSDDHIEQSPSVPKSAKSAVAAWYIDSFLLH